MSVNQLTNVFGGFAPFPNTIATALLAYQSEAIGFGFGIKFQYSKRLIGAMTNEEFNALTPITIGAIVEAHNTELIKRMADEMPKWLEIQKNFIEASVAIEIAKANRTPSAMAEIFTAFVTATSELGDDVTFANFADKWNAFFGGNQIFTPPPDIIDDTIPPEPPIAEHIEGDIHPPEEHDADAQLQLIIADQALFKLIVFSLLDPIAGITRTVNLGEHTHAQHHTLLTSAQSNKTNGEAVYKISLSNTFWHNLNVEYGKQINNKFLH